MALNQPERIWWKPIGKQERIWVVTSFVFVVILFFSMPLWHIFAKQNTPGLVYRVPPQQYQKIVDQFVEKYQVRIENNLPVVRAPEGDVYLLARQYAWYPILELELGKTYRIHTSSLDVNHGFSLQPANMNFQVLPGYDYVLTMTPTVPGEHIIICNEFCGVGHHNMSGKLLVRE